MKTKICIFLITFVFMLSLAATSSAEKLFWVDCGPEFDCTNAKLNYVDSSSATPKVPFVTGVFVNVDYDDIFDNILEFPGGIGDGHAFLTGILDPITYQLTGLSNNMVNLKNLITS